MNYEIQDSLERITTGKTEQQQSKSHTPLLVAGFFCIIASLGIFLLQDLEIVKSSDNTFGLFLLNYVLAAGYLIVLLVQRVFKAAARVHYLDYLMLFLVLGLISDFSLNREMAIFNPSVGWFSGWLVLVAGAMVGYSFRPLLPKPLQPVMVFLLGSGMVLFGYFALYLAPFYFIGLLGAFAIGIGLHVFIPLCSLIFLYVGAGRLYRNNLALKRTFLAGILFPLLLALVFLTLWEQSSRQINQVLQEYQVQDQQDLPCWVALSQKLPNTPLVERLIQSDVIYQSASDTFEPFSFPDQRFENEQRHDPLVVVATRLFRKPELSKEEKIKIMESRHDARHQTLDRLWSGQHLSTSSVITQAQIFPQYRLSYTEKILRVYNHKASTWGQEEAIYTFHLPEGSVVTSLSLWINDVEEKGYLTTKSKADSAYKTIVGVEARDPSVVHWQEGNTVSVRVFPCTPQESRQFKIGITSPLRVEQNQLVYENIYFDGPSAEEASETTVIRWENPAAPIELPAGFKVKGTNRFERFADYEADWKLQFPVQKLADGGFSFAGKSYQLQDHRKKNEPFRPARVYLDVNKTWTADELASVWQAVQDVKVYAYLDGSFVQVTAENKEVIFEQLQTLHFSLFPVHKVKEPEQALIISKGTATSPNLSDIKESRFAAGFAKTDLKQAPVRLFLLGSDLSPYLKTLKELHLLHVDQGTVSELENLLSQRQFSSPNADPNAVVLAESGTKIVRSELPVTAATPAPDHLLRLFAYNHLLQQVGPNYFRKDYLEEHLLEEAAQANVVSPLSSLVVLETQADYERFDIKKNKDSLGNASLKSAGSVPEPHEWLLIFLVIAVVTVFVLKPQLFS